MTPEETILLEKVTSEATKAVEAVIKTQFTDKNIPLTEEVKALQETTKNIVTKKQYDELVTAMNAQGLELKALKENPANNKGNDLKSQIFDFIAKNADKIKELKSKGTGVIEFKSVGTMLTTSAGVPDGIPALQGVQVAPPSNVNLISTFIDGLVSKLGTSLASYAYTESVPKDGSYTFIGEGVIKTQIDFKTETRYAAPKKIAAWMELSEEAIQDIPNLQSIAYDYLKKAHDLKRQNGIIFGDGLSYNPKGAITYARTFSADGMAGTVVNPNIMDVINAAITDIYTTQNYTDEMPYMANLVMLNPTDFYVQFVSAKTSFGTPLYPQASLVNRVTIGGVTIIPFIDIPSGYIFVADMSKYNVTDYIGYNVRIGHINDELIHNLFCIVAESRFHAFVKNLDKQAFLYDSIATITAAIEKGNGA